MSHSSPVRPGEQTLQLDIPVILPGVDDAHDGCVGRFQDLLRGQTGVTDAHIQTEHGQSHLCLHYNPNLVPLERVQRLAKDFGAQITSRYKHETYPIKGMDCASCAASIEHLVRKMPGVLNVSVNYAVEKMKVEFDSTLTSQEKITGAVRALGYRVGGKRASTRRRFVPKGDVIPLTMVSPAPAPPSHDHDHDHDHDHSACGHDHGHDHAKHPHKEHDHAEPDHHDGHAATWLGRNPELTLSIVSGVLTFLGFICERFFHLPPLAATGVYLLAYIAGGFNLVKHTFPAVIRGRFDVDLLMLLAAVGAAILNEWAEGALLLFLFSFGHSLEHFAMNRARNAIRSLGQVIPRVARIREGNEEVEIPVEDLLVGDFAIIRPGERVAVDGRIRSGRSTLDQSPITGESIPVGKGEGEEVFAGSINGDGALVVEVTKLSDDTTMARVIQMVEEAQSQKSPTQTFTEKFERVFVPLVIGGVVLAAVIPPLANWLPWNVAILRALSALVAASPCALALSTPAGVLAGIGQAARNGVLIKGGVHLENLGSLRALALDKTGTLTIGRPEVTDVLPSAGVTEEELLKLAGALETGSTHPLAKAVVRRVEAEDLDLPVASDIQNLSGRGLQAQINGEIVRLGNLRFMEESGVAVPADMAARLHALSDTGKPLIAVSRANQFVGALALADQVRPEARETMEKLRKIGIRHLVMLTGDNGRVAANIASTAGITEVRSELLPGDKVTVLKDLLAQHGQVAMIGDGVNDAPALALATVGIAMGAGGTDVALETSDVALMADDLAKLPFAVGLSRASRGIIKQNVCIALGTIALLLPATLFGYASIGIAVILHEGSTLIVVFNALRLLGYKSD